MDQRAYEEFVVGGSRRAMSSPVGTIGYLVLTQTRKLHAGDVPKIREPELRHGLAQEAEARRVPYGIEVPTKGTYRFTEEPGDGQISARHDFAVLGGPRHDSERCVLVELKEGQVPVRKLSKDMEKLLRETATSGKIRRPNDSSFSIDRRDSSKGYTVDNVAVISWLANRLKSNAEAWQLECIAAWMRGQDLDHDGAGEGLLW